MSGSDQVTSSLDSRYLEINGDNVILNLQQVNSNSITNFDTNVVDEINDENVHSGSYLGTSTTTNLLKVQIFITQFFRVLSYIDGLGVFSGSEQFLQVLFQVLHRYKQYYRVELYLNNTN